MTTEAGAVDVPVEERRLLDSIPVGLLVTDAAGYLVQANASWSGLSGLSQRSSIGEGWWAVVDVADRRRLRTDLEGVAADGVHRSGNYRLAGDPRSLRWRVRRRDSDGGPLLVVAVFAEPAVEGSGGIAIGMADRLIGELFAIGLTLATVMVDDAAAARLDEAVELIDRLIHDVRASVFEVVSATPPAAAEEAEGVGGNGELSRPVMP